MHLTNFVSFRLPCQYDFKFVTEYGQPAEPSAIFRVCSDTNSTPGTSIFRSRMLEFRNFNSQVIWIFLDCILMHSGDVVVLRVGRTIKVVHSI